MGIESPVHLLFLAAVALIVLGPKRLPALAKALGQGIREFRESLTEGALQDHPVERPPALAPGQVVQAGQMAVPARCRWTGRSRRATRRSRRRQSIVSAPTGAGRSARAERSAGGRLTRGPFAA